MGIQNLCHLSPRQHRKDQLFLAEREICGIDKGVHCCVYELAIGIETSCYVDVVMKEVGNIGG